MKNRKAIWVTQTAMLIALIVLAQLLQNVIPPVLIGPFNLKQLVTGSLVNLVLIIGAFKTGMTGGGAAALISPVLAAALGVIPGGVLQMVPVVMAGNLVIVFITWLCFRASNGLSKGGTAVLIGIGIAAGALLKTLTLYTGTQKLVIPLLHIAPPTAKVLTATMSAPQIVTGIVGGVLALLVMPAFGGFKKVRR